MRNIHFCHFQCTIWYVRILCHWHEICISAFFHLYMLNPLMLGRSTPICPMVLSTIVCSACRYDVSEWRGQFITLMFFQSKMISKLVYNILERWEMNNAPTHAPPFQGIYYGSRQPPRVLLDCAIVCCTMLRGKWFLVVATLATLQVMPGNCVTYQRTKERKRIARFGADNVDNISKGIPH